MGLRSNHISSAAYLVLALVVFGLTWEYLKIPERPKNLQVQLDVRSLRSDSIQLFYDADNKGFFEDRSLWGYVEAAMEVQTLEFVLPEMQALHKLRLDPGSGAGELELHGFRLSSAYASWELDGDGIEEHFLPNDSCTLSLDSTSTVLVERNAEDAFLVCEDLAEVTEGMINSIRPVVWPFAAACLAGIFCFILLHYGRLLHYIVLIVEALWKGLNLLATLRGGVALLFALLAFWLAKKGFEQVHFHNVEAKLVLSGTFEEDDDLQVYFANKEHQWNASHLTTGKVYGSPKGQLAEFILPDSIHLRHLRLDLGAKQSQVLLDSLTLYTPYAQHSWSAEELRDQYFPNDHVVGFKLQGEQLLLELVGNDAYLCSVLYHGAIQKEVMTAAYRSPWPMFLAMAIGLFVLMVIWAWHPLLLVGGNVGAADLALAGSFCVMLALPIMDGWIPIDPKPVVIEKRAKAEKPVLKASELLQYPKAYNDYYSDHFGFRKSMVRWNALVKGVGLGVSPKRDAVVFGKDGWMFYTGLNVKDHYVHRTLFTTAELARITKKLENRQAWLKEQGADFYLAIAPLKGTIYPEFLPDNFHRINDQSKLDQLTEHLQRHSNVNIVDLRPALLKAKESQQIYYKTDTHWNLLGAYVAYVELTKRIALDHPEVIPMLPDQFDLSSEWKENADLTNLIGLNDIYLRKKYMLHPKKPFNAIDVAGGTYTINQFFKMKPTFERNDSLSGPDLVMFRDSYCVYMRPFLSEHFHKSTYVWSPLFHPEPIEREKPDIVVHELLERFIDDLLLDDPGEPRYPQ